MKKILLTILVLTLISSFIDENKKPTLRWGLIGIKNELVVDETEITVGEWLEYVYYKNPTKIRNYVSLGNISLSKLTLQEENYLIRNIDTSNAFPDRTILQERSLNYLFQNGNKKRLISYSGLNGRIVIPVDSLAYKQNKTRVINDIILPISGITYQQALDFCLWRSKLDSLKFKNIHQKSTTSIENIKKEFYVFELPNKEEFKKFNCNKDSLSLKGFSNFNYKNSFPKKNKPPYSYTGKNLIQPWLSLYQNNSKAFSKRIFSSLDHVQGNVAEMSKEKGICFGGSYLHHAKKSYAGIAIEYKKPEIWLGLRCVGKKLTVAY